MPFLGIPSWGRHMYSPYHALKHRWSTSPVPIGPTGFVIPPVPRPTRRATRLHLALCCVTVLTTILAGMRWADIASPLQHMELWYRGIPFAGTLLAILFCHEMGHYVTARFYGMDVTFPYFLPSPPFIMDIPFLGTFGAVIRMKSAPRHRRALLLVGAAGPIAGFCVALPALIYALATATHVPMAATTGEMSFASPLLVDLLQYLLLGTLPDGIVLQINSVGVAAWFGLLVTVFNLLPLGQLDGGHILYALLGPQARYLSWAVMGVLLILGFVAWPGWVLWAVLGWLSGRQQPTVLDQQEPLGRISQVIAAMALAIFVLCFVPIPMQ